MSYSIVHSADAPPGAELMEITEDVYLVLQKAQQLSVGRQVLVYLFEWFLDVVAKVYTDQGIGPEDRVQLDENFFDVLSKATRFGLKAYIMYEEIFEYTEGGGDSVVDDTKA